MKVKHKGEIRWFDSLRGEGVVRLETGASYSFHISAYDKEFNSRFARPFEMAHHDRWFKSGTKVLCSLYEDSHFVMIDHIEVV